MFEFLGIIEFSLTKTAVVILAVAALATYDIFRRLQGHQTHYIFACVLGTILSLGLIQVGEILLSLPAIKNPHAMALGLVLLLVLWKALFGPWRAATKVTILGTFLFWIACHLFALKPPVERTSHALAIVVALIPAGIWCALFFKYHRERLSHLLLMFFAGILSTMPILFYDALVSRGVELQFFLFRVVPESFNATSRQFVAGQLTNMNAVHSTLLATLLSFLLVGTIEECSKYWVLKKSGKGIFSSIDDVMHFGIVVAIGFAFAENVSNSGYFLNFVREYLVFPETPDILGFISNVIGRSVLTNMVHIVSTGVMGYFLGVAIFASPYLADEDRAHEEHRITEWLHRTFHLSRVRVFRLLMLTTGLFAAIMLHGLFNFLVTLPDLLPGQPHTLGELFGWSFPWISSLPILLFPALLYVVGGFWLLTELFLKKENMKERGRVVTVETLEKE